MQRLRSRVSSARSSRGEALSLTPFDLVLTGTQVPKTPAPIPDHEQPGAIGLRVSRTICTAPARNSASVPVSQIRHIISPHRRPLQDIGGSPMSPAWGCQQTLPVTVALSCCAARCMSGWPGTDVHQVALSCCAARCLHEENRRRPRAVRQAGDLTGLESTPDCRLCAYMCTARMCATIAGACVIGRLRRLPSAPPVYPVRSVLIVEVDVRLFYVVVGDGACGGVEVRLRAEDVLYCFRDVEFVGEA